MNKSFFKITNWKFKEQYTENWHVALVPGTVHTDLLKNQEIPHPFEETNEKDLQWIDKKNWLYQSTFEINEETLKYSNIQLVFEGLDTYAQIYLNDELLLETDNMFITWRADIKPLAKLGENKLAIMFLSPITKGMEQLEKIGYILPAPNDDSQLGEIGETKLSVYTRKAPYHYGWDWGPRFVTSGIWKDIKVEYWSDVTIEDLYIEQHDITHDRADIKAHITLKSDSDQTVSGLLSAEGLSIEKEYSLTAGINQIEIPVRIDRPRLWWTKQLGDQAFYHFNFSMQLSDNHTVSHEVRTGLRSIKLVNQDDKDGTSFHFELNGIPIFIKGANHIPNDTFLPEVDEKRYRIEIEAAVLANMNMLRVWGGGIYESDYFYRLCDENGLLVWQDFLFACSMYPGSDAFLESVTQEARDNIIRLRNHPSLAIWCGNNEIDITWKQYVPNNSWGWKEWYDSDLREKIWQDYDTIFHKLLPSVLNEVSPGVSYWPSSPLAELTYDVNQHASIRSGKGDVHFWNVWHSLEPIEVFNDKIGRFMSEYGFQSYPEMATIRKMTNETTLSLDTPVIAAHQKNKSGNDLLLKYLEAYYGPLKDFDSVIYLSQTLQAYALETAILAHRRNMPYCMGTLYWQLNDSWPGASWSSIDYYGNWKAAHYHVKHAYQDIVLSYEVKDDKIVIYGINDTLEPFKADLTLFLFNYSGERLHTLTLPVTLDANQATILHEMEWKDEYSASEVYLYAELNQDGLIDARPYYFKRFSEGILQQPAIKMEQKITGDTTTFTFTTDKPAKNVCLSSDIPGRFSDNYFDLHPGITKEVSFITDEETSPSVTIQSMFDFLQVGIDVSPDGFQ